jgi:hypothetical protein
VGNVANGVTDSGAPVKVGGKANSSQPSAVTSGQRVDAWYSTGGGAVVCVAGTAAPSDNGNITQFLDFAGNARSVFVGTGLFNGSGWDRQRCNQELTVLASAARTGSVNSGDQTNFNNTRIKVVIDITALAGSPSLTFTIKGKSALSGKYFTLLASAALTGVGTTVLTVAPGATVTANVSINDFVPRLWRVEVVAGTADSVTYSVDAQVVL